MVQHELGRVYAVQHQNDDRDFAWPSSFALLQLKRPQGVGIPLKGNIPVIEVCIFV